MVRAIRWTFAVLVGLLITLPAGAQFDRGGRGGFGGPGGGGPGGGGPGGGGRGMGDPNEMFNRMANGKEVLVRSEISNEFMQRMFDRIAGQVGVTNGVITRQQFTTYMQERMSGGGRGGPPGGGTGGPGGPPGGGMGGPGGSQGSSPWGNPDAMADMFFRRMDQNGDGLLNYDEMSESLRIEREKHDTNRDGFIDQTEFKAYIQARFQNRDGQGGSGGPMGNWPGMMPQTIPQIEEEEQKPVVYRAGKLPKDMPSWFTQLDADNDGQIGLYEWKSSGRSFDEFDKLDRNGDGFVVVDEVLRSLPGRDGKNGTATADSRSSYFNGPGSSGTSGMMMLQPGSDGGRSMSPQGGDNAMSSRSPDGRSGPGSFGDRGRGDRGSFGMGGSGGPGGFGDRGRGDRGSFGMGGPGGSSGFGGPGGGRGDRGSFGMGGSGGGPSGSGGFPSRGDRGSFGMGGPGGPGGGRGDRGSFGMGGSGGPGGGRGDRNGSSNSDRGNRNGGPGRNGRS